MQKKIIALAIAAAASGAALAQSNVTVYGIADASFENVRGSGGNGVAAEAASTNSIASRQRVASNASYIGFKGTEDLGNGLKAVFQFENELDISGTTGNSRANALASRDTFVGATGGFGTVIAGWLSSPHRSTAAKYDLMPGAAGTGGALNLIGRVNVGSAFQPLGANGVSTQTFGTQTLGGVTQANNIGVIARHSAIAYVTPTISGFSGVVAYVANETKDNTSGLAVNTAQRNPSAWNLALHYDNGPLSLSYSYLNIKDFGVGVATNTAGTLDLSGKESHAAHLLGAKYTFGNTTISAMYDHFKGELGDGANAAFTGDVTLKRNAWYLGAKHTVGKSDFTVAYARVGDNKVNVGSRAAAERDAESGAEMYSLRYGYNLSKRTQAYAQYTRLKNDKNASFDLGVSSTAMTSTTGAVGTGTVFAGTDLSALGVGLRHSF